MIKLNRVDEHRQKIHLKVNVQKTLTFEQKKYRLQSFICHQGEEVQSGHYTAFSFSSDGQGMEFDDRGVPGTPQYTAVSEQYLEEHLKNSATILFYQLAESSIEDSALLSPSPVPASPRTPLRTPTSIFIQSQGDVSPSVAPSRSPSNSPFSKSPRFGPKARALEALSEEEARQDSRQFIVGSVPDVMFVRRRDEAQSLRKENFRNFYVAIPGQALIMFRVENQTKCSPQQVLDYLLSNDSKWRLPFSHPKLFYKDPEREIEQSDVSLLPPHSVLVLANQDYNIRHSGKIWSCSCSDENCPECTDDEGFPLGFLRNEKFNNHKKKKKCGCSLFNEEFLRGKTMWGKIQEKPTAVIPFGCPQDLKQQDVSNQDNNKNLETGPNSNENPIAGQSMVQERFDPGKRPSVKYQRKAALQKAVLEEDSMESDENDNSEEAVTHPQPKSHPLPVLVDTPEVNEAREKRRITCSTMLEMDFSIDNAFVPNTEDKEFERVHIRKPCFSKKNKKFEIAKQTFKPESIQLMKEGHLPKFKPDRNNIPSTWELYQEGARRVLGIFQKILKREVHYHDFLAFGEPNLIHARNIIEQIDEDLPTGNHKSNAYVAYQMILEAASTLSSIDEMKFQTLIRDSIRTDLTEVQLKHECHIQATSFRSEITNILKQMEAEKPHGLFKRQKAHETERNRRNRELLGGHTILNPAQILPKYFKDPAVQKVENDLIKAASNTEYVPSPKEFHEFTNSLLVRLDVKNGKRKEIFTNLPREEFLIAKRNGVKIVKVTPTQQDDHEGTQHNVFNLGDGIGRVQIEEVDVNMDTASSHLEAVVLRRKIHKTGDKGEAVVLLSWPDLILMESYQALAKRYCKANNLEYPSDGYFFINKQGGKVDNIYFGDFCRITGYADYNSHLSRKIYVTWMIQQDSIQLAEYAAFAANHSREVQTAWYLGAQSKRKFALAADHHYHDQVLPEDETEQLLETGQRVQISEEYEEDVQRDLAELDDRNWRQSLEKEKEQDLRQIPRRDGKVITPDVLVNLLSLIVALGMERTVEKETGINLLDFFLGETVGYRNERGKGLILSMIDFAPELPQSRVLQENLNIFCTMFSSTSSVDDIERKWAGKLVDALRRFTKSEAVPTLSNRILDILCPLNRDHAFKYCFGNKDVKHKVQKQLEHWDSLQNWRHRPSVSVISAVEIMRKRTERRNANRQRDLEREAEERQVDNIAESRSDQTEIESDNHQFFDHIPEPQEEILTVVNSPKEAARKRLHIRTQDGSMNLEIAGPAVISQSDVTPSKRLYRDLANTTPSRDPSLGRRQNLSNLDKIEILQLFMMEAREPFETHKRAQMKTDCEMLFQKRSISRGQLKGDVYNKSENIADLLVGKANAGLSKGPFARKPIIKYIDWGMEHYYPGTLKEDWTRAQLREIVPQIIKKAKDDVGL